MFDKANEALKNWKSLLPMLRPLIKNETKNAVRRKKMNVATAPNGATIGVTDPVDTTVINIPYQPACSNVSVGQSVWVEWLYDNFSTAIAVTPGDGIITVPYTTDSDGIKLNGMIKLYDGNGVERLRLNAGGNGVANTIAMFDESGYQTLQIRGNHTASAIPLAVNQGGTGQTTQFPKIRYVSGSVVNTQSADMVVCSTSLPAGYSYMIYGYINTNNGAGIQISADITGVTYSLAPVRVNVGSGQGVLATAYLSAKNTATTVNLKSYGYTSSDMTIRGAMLIYQFPAMPTF